ncbi:MAG: head decoration protein [Desulfobulbus sp.]
MVTEATLTMPALLASDTFGPVLIPQTIAAGADLAKGTILGRITASGKLVAAAAASSDGSQTPVAVLMEDAAAASADVSATVGFAGVYVEASMTGLTAAYKLALEPKGLYFV